jgi:hypothetical protein
VTGSVIAASLKSVSGSLASNQSFHSGTPEDDEELLLDDELVLLELVDDDEWLVELLDESDWLVLDKELLE